MVFCGITEDFQLHDSDTLVADGRRPQILIPQPHYQTRLAQHAASIRGKIVSLRLHDQEVDAFHYGIVTLMVPVMLERWVKSKRHHPPWDPDPKLDTRHEHLTR